MKDNLFLFFVFLCLSVVYVCIVLGHCIDSYDCFFL